jgi:hypothetical protein
MTQNESDVSDRTLVVLERVKHCGPSFVEPPSVLKAAFACLVIGLAGSRWLQIGKAVKQCTGGRASVAIAGHLPFKRSH